MAQKVASYLAQEWGTEVRIDQVEILFFDSAEIKGLYAEDLKGDTLIYANKIWVEIDDFSIKNKFFYIDNIELEDTRAFLIKHQGENHLNLKFIIDYFSPEEKDTSKSDFDFRIHNAHFKNVFFVFQDKNIPDIDFGMNYQNIQVENVDLSISDFRLIEGGVAASILDIQAKEQSGFELTSFQTDMSIDSSGLKMNGVHIETQYSDIDLQQLNFLTKNWRSWVNFEDSVKLDAQIESSKIDLEDISYFAPILKGLTHDLFVEGKVKGNVRKLKVRDFDLRTGKETHIAGRFNLPDYRDFYNSFIDLDFSNIQTCVEDLESIPLFPFDSGENIQIPSNLKGLGTISIDDGFVYGPISGDGFVLKAHAKSGLGNVNATRGIKINYNFKDSTFYYEGPQDPTKFDQKNHDLVIENLNLGAITGNSIFGKLNGGVFIDGKGLSKQDLNINLSGDINNLQFKGYTYQDFKISNGKIANNQFKGEVSLEDENIGLTYNGVVNFGSSNVMDFSLDIRQAMLTELNIIPYDSSRKSTELNTKIHVKTYGSNFNNLKGTVGLSNFSFKQDTMLVNIDTFGIQISRSKKIDSLLINSDIIDASIFGKFDLKTIQNSMRNQFLKIFPEYFANNKEFTESNSKFSYTINLKKSQPVLDLFIDKLKIADNTTLSGNFSSQENILELKLNSSFIQYDNIIVDSVYIENSAAPMELDMKLKIGHIQTSKDLKFNHINFYAKGKNNFINADLDWKVDKYPDSEGKLVWETQIVSPENYILDFDVSKIPVRGKTWVVEDKGILFINKDDYELSGINISKGNHKINLNGILSKDPTQSLDFIISNFELKDLDEFLPNDLSLDGTLNANGSIRDIFTNMDFNTIASIDSFHINEELIGNIEFNQVWNKNDKSFDLNGGIKRKFKQIAHEIKTFDFKGKYFLFKENDNLDIDLIFDKTDISFVNSFLPKDQISNVRGFINGKLKMSGSLAEPIFLGKVDFQAGNAYIDLLGNNFGLMGEIQSEDYGFIINHMYITDPEGNTGKVTGSIFHNYFKDWNFEAIFNLTDNPFEYYASGPDAGFPKPLEKFLLLNTDYEDGDYYYGKGYVTGYASIFGYANHFEINADIKTLRGTKINFPMYGATEVTEDDFIVFKSKDTTNIEVKKSSNFQGLDLNLNFNITPETEAKIIFDESTGDLIEAKGAGLISLNMNNIGELSMTGKYTIAQGKYYLSMKNLIKKDFTLRKGGTIDWTGKPYDADLDVQAVYSVKASFSEAVPDITNSDNSTSKDQVECVLSLSNTLVQPQMDIDIQSPTNNESAKAALSRIKSSEDELNRQFFSLLMLQKFQPILSIQQGGNAGVYNALGEALTGQLNSILNSIDENYNFNVNYNQDDVNKTQTYEVGMSTEVLNDRLIISGSFGLENYSGGTQTQNNFIGDIKIEYKLNKDGSFRVNVFNESNDTRVIQSKALGQFTQGIGFHYEEDFDSVDSLKFLQYFLDLFRKNEKRRFWKLKKKSENPKFRSVYEDGSSRGPGFSSQDSVSVDSVEQGLQDERINLELKQDFPEPPFEKDYYFNYRKKITKPDEYNFIFKNTSSQ